jgi:sulfur carrier protein
MSPSVTIRLNGESHDLPGPLTVADLLARLGIDPRRVAVEQNHLVVKRAQYGETLVQEGDAIEIVNFVGGGLI